MIVRCVICGREVAQPREQDAKRGRLLPESIQFEFDVCDWLNVSFPVHHLPEGAYRATCTIEPIDMSDRAQAGDVRKLTLVQDLLTACEAALEAIRSDADVDWMLSVESQLCAVIAEARGGEE